MSTEYTTTEDLIKKYQVNRYADIPFEEIDSLFYRKTEFNKMVKTLMKSYGFVPDKISSSSTNLIFIKRSDNGYCYIRLTNPMKTKSNAYNIKFYYSLYALNLFEGLNYDEKYINDLGIFITDIQAINPYKDNMYFFDLNFFRTNEEALDLLNKLIFDKKGVNESFFEQKDKEVIHNKSAQDNYEHFSKITFEWLNFSLQNKEKPQEVYLKYKPEWHKIAENETDVNSFLNYYGAYRLYKKMPFEKNGLTLDSFKKFLIKSLFYFGIKHDFLEKKYNTPFKSEIYSMYGGIYDLTSSQFSYMLFMTFIEKYLQ